MSTEEKRILNLYICNYNDTTPVNMIKDIMKSSFNTKFDIKILNSDIASIKYDGEKCKYPSIAIYANNISNMKNADIVILLRGWESYPMAIIEAGIAKSFRIPVYELTYSIMRINSSNEYHYFLSEVTKKIGIIEDADKK